jgi:hypothetical protein
MPTPAVEKAMAETGVAAALERPWVIAVVVLAIVLVVSLLSRVATGVRDPVARETIAQTDTLLKAASKWALMSEQDTNVIISLMHIAYAKAYISALRRILSDAQIEKAHQVDMCDLEQRMDRLEHAALKRISVQAPEIMPDGEFAIRTGWLG